MNLVKTPNFTLAVNTRGNKKSTRIAIVLPGRLDTKDYECFNRHIEFLASKGFLALSFDPPGTWESPGGIELFTTSNYIKAVNELIGYFSNRPTFLLGHSRGGQVAMLVGTTNSKVMGFAVINASYDPPALPDSADIHDGAVVEWHDLPPGTSKTPEKKKFTLPLNFFRDGQQFDPKPALKLCTKPKLLFIGTRDEFYRVEEVQEIYEAIPPPKMIHKLYTNHDYRLHPEIVEEVNKVLEQFLNKYFPE